MLDRQKKKELILNFDPNNPGISGNIFGLPFDLETSDVVLIPVPWDVTVSYKAGACHGPEAILAASTQLDYYLPDNPQAWHKGIYMLPIRKEWEQQNKALRPKSQQYIHALEAGKNLQKYSNDLQEINEACNSLHQAIKQLSVQLLNQDKIVGIVGGEHSAPLGLLQALAETKGDFGVLQVDAHADLREAYEGFKYSHASIMHNALDLSAIKQLVQVGIRDICEAEIQLVQNEPERITIFFDQHLKEEQFEGIGWATVCENIVNKLPQQVYISFDIDGLQPYFCPHTGTPVPGGLSYSEAVYLIKVIKKSGRKIIGFDLCEVAPGNDEWDANVGARVLYQLCANAG